MPREYHAAAREANGAARLTAAAPFGDKDGVRTSEGARADARATAPPADGVAVAFYDGHCGFCTTAAQDLARTARGRLALRSFQEPGALDAFPGLTHEQCMRELVLVDARGRVFGGAAAVVRALRIGRPVLGALALAYYLPGVRWLCDRAYVRIARNRYRLFGKTGPACDGDACAVHFDGR
jgi:predicted DCC family thiol-disulfide oxidoreductase YuxK